MSWNLFKTRLNSKLRKPSVELSATTSRLPSLTANLDQIYSTHFDVATSGGRIQNNPSVSQVVKLGLQTQFLQNRKNAALAHSKVSKQLGMQASKYWQGKLIQGPTGSTIILSSGIWMPFDARPNMIPGGKKFVDRLTMSLYNQKNSLLGVTIQKAPPGTVVPWTGMMLQGFDTPIAIDKLLDPMEMNYNNFVDIMIEMQGGKPSDAQDLKDLFKESLEKTFDPEIFELMSSFKSEYGIDFNNLDYKQLATKSFDFSKFIN